MGNRYCLICLLKENKRIFMKLAIILTCHNRIEKTKMALNTLINEEFLKQYNCDYIISLCDDGSSDNTANIIKSIYGEKVIVSYGNGNLFWNKGMALAMNSIKDVDVDFYIMINDDTIFYENALEIMFENFFSYNDKKIAISGAFHDEKLVTSYGGINVVNGIGVWVNPRDSILECELANWNCFLISKNYFNKIGEIDSYYQHAYGDWDYSKRIKLDGGHIYVTNKYVGICNRNPDKGTYRDVKLGKMKRLWLMVQKNSVPFKSQLHYCRKFYKDEWIKRTMMPYIFLIVGDWRIYKKICNLRDVKKII